MNYNKKVCSKCYNKYMKQEVMISEREYMTRLLANKVQYDCGCTAPENSGYRVSEEELKEIRGE